MGEVLRRVETSPVFLETMKQKVSCFMCRYIVEDIEQRGKLTGFPLDSFDKGTFPVDAKLTHVLLEMGEIPPQDPESDEELAAAVVALLKI